MSQIAALVALFDAFARAALAGLVGRLISTNAWSATGKAPRFDDLVFMVRCHDPDADVCEIDRAARPYQRGNPGAYTYEPPFLGEQIALPLPEAP